MSLADLMAQELPMNRKERFFTGTVFPMIVCAEGFKHFDRLLGLSPDCPTIAVDPSPEATNIQFFTEYGLLESIYGPVKDRFPTPPESRDTPDILILIAGHPKILIALEAKMYDRPTREAVEEQMHRQGTIVLDYLQKALAIPIVVHAALLPSGLMKEFGGFKYPVVTWEALLDAFSEGREDDYWMRMLRLALDGWPELVGPMHGKNAEGRLNGLEIHHGLKDGTLKFTLMGRNEGLGGEPLDEDIRSGRWKKQVYEVRHEGPPPNKNWFSVAEFVKLVETLGRDVPA